MYADDTVIFCEENMKQALIALHNYCNEWKLNVNCSKTKMAVFCRGKIQINNFNFKLGNEKFEVVYEYYE